MTKRFYIPGPWHQAELELDGSEAHHLIHVSRLGPGDEIEIFDGLGKSAPAVIQQKSRKSATVTWNQSQLSTEAPYSPAYVLATAVPKGDRFRWLIEKATELGIATIIPLTTERSVVSPRETKLDKLRGYSIEACKQSGRNHVLEVEPMITWTEFCEQIVTQQERGIIGVVDSTSGSRNSLKELFENAPQRIIIAVGPEGGWTMTELELGYDSGLIPCHCGQHILRTETAGLALASYLQGFSSALENA